MKINKPNFFIVGAPKCGTTALATYLNEHENVFISNPKEPHYYATDFPKYRCCTEEEKYFELFHNANEDGAIGEASVFYLYSKEAIKNIHANYPDAKIIVMLRNPIEMVYSLHSQLFYTADEDVEDFKTAWELEEDRKKGLHIPSKCREPKLLFYKEVAKYSEQLENIYQYFPKSQVEVILFDEFKKDTLNVYKNILAFLNVDYDGRNEFKKINENKKIKSQTINELVVRTPSFIKKSVKFIKTILGVKKLGFLDYIRKNNTDITKREPMKEDTREKVYETYKDDIHKLSILLEKDLSTWK